MDKPTVTFSSEKNQASGRTRVFADIDPDAFATVGQRHLLPAIVDGVSTAVAKELTKELIERYREEILALITPAVVAEAIVQRIAKVVLESLKGESV